MAGHTLNVVDETLVISLPERTDRRERVATHLAMEGIPFTFVNGCRVTREEIDEREIDELYWADFKAENSWDLYLAAAVGCKRAHINCLESALDRKVSRLLILEDDVAFRPEWQSIFDHAYSQLPKGWLQLYFSAFMLTPERPIRSHLSRLTRACQTTAILYSRNGIEAALSCVLRARSELDWWMGQHLHPFGCSYVVRPQITFQVGGFSDCRGVIRPETP